MDEFSDISSLHRLVWTGLGAAGIALGTLIQVHIGPVPITLQTYAVVLVGFVLGPMFGPMAVALYLLAGISGLPVFSGAGAGVGHIFGPTGGFLLGFIPAAAVAGMARSLSSRPSMGRFFLFGLSALCAVYVLGIPWLKTALDISWVRALQAGCFPFLPGAALKLVLAVLTARMLVRQGLMPT
jgi:biotin transport system substrate-specific component